MHRTLVVFTFALAFISPSIQAAEPPAKTFAGSTSVVLVEVPVRVLDDGKPVRGLKAEDFVILDDGKERPLSSFEVVDLTVAATGPTANPNDIPPAARRHFLLLFDLAFTPLEGLVRAEKAARSLVEEHMTASDLVGIAFYSDRKGATLPLYFTSDKSEVLRVLDALASLLGVRGAREVPRGSRRDRLSGDPLHLVAGNFDAVAAEIGSHGGFPTNPAADARDSEAVGSGGGRGRGGGGSNETLAAMADVAAEALRMEQRHKVRAMADGFSSLAKLTRSVEGTKYLVMFSNGFPEDLYYNDVTTGGGGTSQTLKALSSMITDFQRAGWSIQTIETTASESNVVGQGVGTGVLSWLATDTGGSLLRNFTDLSVAMEKVVDRTDVTYLLSFSTDVAEDGAFHPIKVKLKNGSRGREVLHRAGYYAPTPFAQQDSLSRAASTAELVLTGEPRDELAARVYAAPFPFDATASVAYVPLVVELDGAPLMATDGPIRLDLYAYSIAADGTVEDFVVQHLELDRDKAAAALRAGGIKFFGDLILPPGSHTLRTLVRNPESGRLTLEVTPIEVPGATGQPALRALPLVFPQVAAEQWVLVRETEAGDASAVESHYPFSLAGQNFLPTLKPTIASDGERELVLYAYDLPQGDFPLSGRVTALGGGSVVPGWKVSLRQRVRGTEGRPDALVVAFAPGPLAAGDYRLDLTVTDPASASRSVSSGRLRVAPPRPSGP